MTVEVELASQRLSVIEPRIAAQNDHTFLLNQGLILEALGGAQLEVLVSQPDRPVDPDPVTIYRSVEAGAVHGLEDSRIHRRPVAVEDCDDAAHTLSISVGSLKPFTKMQLVISS